MKPKMPQSIQNQLRTIVSIVVIFCLAVVSLGAVAAYTLLGSTDDFFQANDQLGEFYQTASAMTLAARDYTMDPVVENYRAYTKLRDRAYAHIDAACQYASSDVIWRFGRLSNMVDSFDETVSKLKGTGQFSYDTYRRLEYLGQLIEDTQPDFVNLLLADMNDRNQENQELWRWQTIASVVLICGVIAVGVWLFCYFQKRVTKPIYQMVDNIYLLGNGTYELKAVEGAAPELNILTNAFSDMAMAISTNVELLQRTAKLDKQLLEQENKNLQTHNHLVQAELRNLQSQINPHFLFNTLNTISKKALLHGEQEICTLMEHTADLLRYSLDKANKISTLSEELVCIQHYFLIQQTRFEGRVSFSLQVDEGLPEITMPAMVLQPLVENAVTHGIKDMTCDAEVCLRAKRLGKYIQVYVEDNGSGIPSDQLEQLMDTIVGRPVVIDADMDTCHIGLRNVYRRLKMYYGDELQFHIESEEECGCVVTLGIPLDLEDSL